MHIHICTQRYLVRSTKLHLYNCLGCLVFPRYSSGLSDRFHWLSALPGRSLTRPSHPATLKDILTGMNICAEDTGQPAEQSIV